MDEFVKQKALEIKGAEENIFSMFSDGEIILSEDCRKYFLQQLATIYNCSLDILKNI